VEVAAVPTYQNDETLASVTGGALNFNAFGNPIAVERFVAPGAPIGGWAGVRVSF
jgi:hypothetical protein